MFVSHRSSKALVFRGSNGRAGLSFVVALASLLTLVFAGTAVAQAPVGLGTADPFAVLAGSTITNTGPSVINGDLGLHPGTAVTGFPPGTVNGARHVNDAVAQQAKADLVTAYNDAAGRPFSATLPPDVGGRILTPGVYRTGSVPSLGLTGPLTLDAQGNPNAVFIFQIESTLTTATDSSVNLINGAQACNVFWQVGSSATLGTRTAFKGNILALTSISVNDAVTVDGRLLARNGAVTLINDTITRARCAIPEPEPGPGPGPGPGPAPPGTEPPGTEPPGTEPPGTEPPGTEPPGTDGPGSGGTGGGGTGTGAPGSSAPGAGPLIRVIGLPGLRQPPARRPGARRPPASAVCATRNFTARVRVRDSDGIRAVRVFLDGRLVKRTSLTRFSLQIKVRGLRVGPHRIKVVARDREGNRSAKTRRFGRCALALPAPRFTG
jgi:hypothetical protein